MHVAMLLGHSKMLQVCRSMVQLTGIWGEQLDYKKKIVEECACSINWQNDLCPKEIWKTNVPIIDIKVTLYS